MAIVVGVGSAVPSRIVGNDHFAPLGLTDKWISSRTGIKQRRWLGPDESLCDLALAASQAALADAGQTAEDIDIVIVATLTHDRISPALATELAAKIGAHGPGAVDVNGACSGFLYALDYAVAKVDAGTAKCVLVCGADATSRILDPDDPASAPLFGDSAGAVIVTAQSCPEQCRTRVHLKSDGSKGRVLFIERDDGRLRMDGVEVYQLAIEAMVSSIRKTCDAAGVAIGDIDLLVPHQANGRIITQVALELGLPPDRAAVYLADMGNTSAASIPSALARAQDDARLRAGAKVVVSAFGAGTSWGSALLDWKGCRHG